VTTLYAPATRSSRALAGDDGTYGPARELAEWKQRIVKAWPGVHIEHVEADAGEPRLGSPLTVRAVVALGELSPDDVCVEVVYGRANEDDELVDPCYLAASPEPLAPGEPSGPGDVKAGPAVRYTGEISLARPGPFGYTVRVLPRHPLLASRAELGVVTWPDAPAGLTNGDLR
jgi:starch phosphorylase